MPKNLKDIETKSSCTAYSSLISPLAKNILEQKAQLLDLPNHMLIQEVNTRWNSTQDMLVRFLEMQVAVFASLKENGVNPTKGEELSTLSDEDIALAEHCTSCLEPLKTITTLLCTERMPTVSIIMPLQNQLQNLMQPKEEDPQVIKEMKNIICTDLGKRYQHLKGFLLRATAIDPLFKSLAFLNENERNQVYDDVAAEAYKLSKLPTKNINQPPPPDRSEGTLPPLPGMPDTVLTTHITDKVEERGILSNMQGKQESASSGEPDEKKK